MFSRQAVVLEFAASRVALGVFTRNGSRLRLERHIGIELPDGGDGTDHWLVEARAAIRGLPHVPGPCVLVLPGHLVLTKFIALPRLGATQREKVIRFETEQSLPVALSDLVWDSTIAAEHKAGLEVMLAAAHRDKVESLCEAARAAGFDVRSVLPGTVALLAAFRAVHPGRDETCAVLDWGARSATMLALEAGRFTARTFAFGTRSMTGEGATHAPEAAARLAQEFNRFMLFLRQHGQGLQPARIYLAGGGARLPKLDTLLAEKLALPVEHVGLATVVERKGTANPGAEAEGGGLSAELVGAAVARLGEGHVTLNLIPSAHGSAGRMRWGRLAVAGAALSIAGLAAPFFRRAPAPETRVAPVVRQAEPPAAALPAAGVERPITEAPAPPAVEGERPFGAEVLAISAEAEPYRLQLVGYVGEPGNYVMTFVRPGRPETLLARSGHRFAELGLTVGTFEVKRVIAMPEAATRIYEVAGRAVVHDDETGEEVLLDSRARKLVPVPRAVLGLSTAAAPSAGLREGESLGDGMATYRIDHIQLDPPEVVVTKRTVSASSLETRLLRPSVEAGRAPPPIAGIPVSASPAISLVATGP